MSTFDSLSDALPSPRDDEPPNLRQDILDEIGDHLDCAIRREQLTGDPAGARERVVEKFGDPAAVARKLWRDALWEKIMSQRLMLGLCAAMLLVCCAAVAMTSVWLNQQDLRMKEQTALFTRMLASTEEANKNLSEQFQAAMKQSQEAVKSQSFSEWSPVELKFVSGTIDGPPVPNVTVTLPSRHSEHIPAMEKKSAMNGVVRFERVKFGAINLMFHLGPDPKSGFFGYRYITLLPGEPYTATIVCPAVIPTPRPVHVQIEWPEDLRQLEPVLAITPSFVVEKTAEWQYMSSFFADDLTSDFLKASQNSGSGYFGSGNFGSGWPYIVALIDQQGAVDLASLEFVQSVLNVINVDDPAGPLFKEFQVVDVVARKHPSEPLTWPGPEFRSINARLILDKTASEISSVFKSPTRTVDGDQRGFGFGTNKGDNDPSYKRIDRSRMTIPLDLSDWRFTIDPDAPASLKLTPSGKSLDEIRKAVQRIDTVFAKLKKDAEQRQRDAERKISSATQPSA
jgi:hypothetical protein